MFFKKNKEKSIFQHVLVNGALIFIIFNIAYLSLVVPFAKKKARSFIDSQSLVFYNSSVVAIKEDLYLDNYSKVISLLMKLIAEEKSFEYVILDLNKKDKGKILITDKKWKIIDHDVFDSGIEADDNRGMLISENPYTFKQVFEYTYPMIVHDLPLGNFKVGANTTSYHSLLNGIYNFIIILNILQIAGTLLMLVLVSKKFKKQLFELQDSAENISKGDFTQRVGLSDVSEVNRLSKTFNKMAISLNEQTNKSLMLAQVVKSTHDGVIIVAENGEVNYVNQSFSDMCGGNDLSFKNINEVKDDNQLENKIYQLIDNIQTKNVDLPFTIDLEIKDVEFSKYYECYINYFSQTNNDGSIYYVVISDITHRKELESELNKFAYIDKLTELPNRRAFLEKLEEHIELYKINNLGFSLMFLDLDDFKIVNDSLGHDYGDEVLKNFSNILKHALRSNDIICRLGGDEFTVLLPNLTDCENITRVAQKVLSNISKPVKIKDSNIKITSSIGIVSCPSDGENSEELLKKADIAMYKSKNKGKNRIYFYESSANAMLNNGLDTETSLSAAISENEINLWYQPQILITSNQIRGLEALMRWETKDGRVLSPGSFNAIDIQSNIALEVGDMVLAKACTNIRESQALGLVKNISINIYSRQLEDKDFPYKYLKALELYGIDKNQVELEISGKCLLSENVNIIRNLDILSEFQVPIAVDDVRIGNEDFMSLNKIDIKAIKIDKSLVNNILIDKVSKSIVSSLIHFGNDLGIDVIAVGVEKEEQIEALAKLHCTIVQGNVFYQPMNLQQINDVIIRRSKPKLAIVN